MSSPESNVHLEASRGTGLSSLFARTLLLSMAPIVFMGLTIALVYFQIIRLNDRLDTVVMNSVPSVTASGELLTQLEKIEGMWWKAYVHRDNPEALQAISFELEDIVDQMNIVRERYSGYSMESKADLLRGHSTAQWATVEPSVKKVVEYLRAGDVQSARSIFDSTLSKKIVEMRDTLSNIDLNNINVIESYRAHATQEAQATTVFGSIISIVLSFLLTAVYASRLARKFGQLTGALAEQASLSRESSVELKETAHQIMASAASSSSAVLQTSSAIDQMRAMMSRTEDNIKDSLKISQSSVQQLESGQKSIGEVSSRIKDLQTAIGEMSGAMDVNNRNLTGILDIMNEISAKTLMINDIVFQTKLLSFNASVEASRAGMHGKGFAVVAEEIGVLATNSQAQGDEIGRLLTEGRERIDHLIEESSQKLRQVEERIQSAVHASDSAVDSSIGVIGNAMSLSQQVDRLLGDVARAINEQYQGSTEVMKATTVLGDIAVKTNEWGQKLTAGSETGLSQAEALSGTAYELQHIVRGA